MDTPEAMFDAQLASAGAAIELSANTSAFTNHLLYQAEKAAIDADISSEDPRRKALAELLEVWDESVAPAFAAATRSDPTGPRGAAVQRPWRNPELARA